MPAEESSRTTVLLLLLWCRLSRRRVMPTYHHRLPESRRDFHVNPLSGGILPAKVFVHAIDSVRILVVETYIDAIVVGRDRVQGVS